MEEGKQSNTVDLSQDTLINLRKFVRDAVWLNEQAVIDKGWVMRITDDKQIIDGDEDALCNAIRVMGSNRFLAVPVNWVLYGQPNKLECQAYVFEATADEIEAFQFHGKGDYISWGDCLLFDENLSFLIIRPDDYCHMLYAGTQEFIDLACSANDWWWPYPEPGLKGK